MERGGGQTKHCMVHTQQRAPVLQGSLVGAQRLGRRQGACWLQMQVLQALALPGVMCIRAVGGG